MTIGLLACGPRATRSRLCRLAVAAAALVPALSATAALADAAVGAPAPPPAASSSVVAASLKVLNETDAQRYAEAFAAAARGDFAAANTAAATIADPSLKGRLAAMRLLNPDYRASYAELSGWLAANADLPEGQRVYDLAMKRRPKDAPAPRPPASADAQTSAVGLGERLSRTLQVRPAAESRAQQAARAAFYEGDAQHAYDLGSTSGDRWITGLAAVRLKRFPEAVKALEPLANDVAEGPWVRSGAAYWGARAAAGGGDAAKAKVLLKLAARSPDTFYGLIAARELDKANAKAPAADAIADVLAAADLDTVADAAFVKSDPRAHRAAALMQIGLPLQAGEELKAAMAAASDTDRPRLTALALALNAPLGGADPAKAGWARFDLGSFPTPALQPLGGFVIDKALVYALVRQESRFNPNASSGAGAYGLMQLTAETAARLAGDPRLRHDPSALRDPGLNLKLGQAYVAKLLAGAKGDVVRAIAAYNSGPGAVQKLAAKMGQDVDSLMLVESMPSGQTRDYVQRVLSYYWTYSQIFGHDAPGALANAK